MLAGRVRRDNRFAAAFDEPVTQLSGVVGSIRQELARRWPELENRARPNQIVRIARGQNEDSGPAELVSQGVDFGGAPAAGGSDGVVEGPPFAPPAERCALT